LGKVSRKNGEKWLGVGFLS